MNLPVRLKDAVLIRTAKIAAALFAVGLTYSLWQSFLHYATEPKVIGGIQIDRPIPQVMQWSPIYAPMTLAALFAYWAWLKRIASGPFWAVTRGSLVGCGIAYFSLFVSFLCPALGAFYLMLLDLMRSEIVAMLGKTALIAAQSTAFFGVFFAVPLLTMGLVAGSAIGFASYGAQSLLLRTSARSAELEGRQFFSSARIMQALLALTAIAVSMAILFAGLHFNGIFIFTFWAQGFVRVAIPCLLVGCAIGWIAPNRIWCVAVGLPIGFYLSTTHTRPEGLLTSQSIDFPPVLFAILIGFGLMRTVRSKLARTQTRLPPLAAN
jgi:hypothetical protein